VSDVNGNQATITYVIPCGAAKQDRPAPARDLYTGPMFRHTLAAAETEAAWCNANGTPTRILVLSALHGLITLDEAIAPYDLRMGQPGSVTAGTIADQAEALGIEHGHQVYGMLPRTYLAVLDDALRTLDVWVQDVYEGTAGIGEQRHVNSIVTAA
jgi:hypothetical protein